MNTAQDESGRFNILFVSDYPLGEFLGGSVRVLYEQSAHLAERGHEVHILTREEQFNEGFSKIENVKEWKYPVNNLNRLVFLRSSFSNSKKSFESLSEECSFHIINFHQPFSAIGVLSSTDSRRVPCLYTCHSLSFEEYISRSSSPRNPIKWILRHLQVTARKSIEHKVLKRSDQVVVLSEYTREKLHLTYGVAPSKVNVIPGGVDLERFRPSTDKDQIRARMGLPEDKFILFTVRNLVPRMGLENLISAFEIVQNKRGDLLLVIGGVGPLETALKEQTKRCGVEDFVRFAGYIPDEALPSYYQVADLFILPTTELEGFGLVTVEALASGLPVLGTPVGGTREILAKLGSNYLFDDSTPQSIVKGILNALNGWATNQAAYKKVSETCRKVAEQHYSWDNHVRKLEDLYYSMLGN
jgi:glycosyltransferase involved in cell wall biosynthesis